MNSTAIRNSLLATSAAFFAAGAAAQQEVARAEAITRGVPDVITVFLRSLTQCWDGKLIAVIVSGYDGDGAAALCGIKEAGGITFAQKLSTATQPDMPESAVASGCIDFILSPEDIARQIVRIARAETQSVSRVRISVPSATSSPAATMTSTTRPA